jgi:hypothetical protein
MDCGARDGERLLYVRRDILHGLECVSIPSSLIPTVDLRYMQPLTVYATSIDEDPEPFTFGLTTRPTQPHCLPRFTRRTQSSSLFPSDKN